MPKLLVHCLLVAELALTSCAFVPDPRPSARLVIASWNVENLFDEVDDGDEYPEFDPGRGWTRAQFWARCDSLSKVIRTLSQGAPDILVLEEVEGAHTLEVLRTRFLSDLGYQYWFLAPDEVSGVKTAFLSRYPLVRSGLHYPSSEARDPLRPIVEVEIDLGGRALVLLGNHWKSRIPTPAATEPLRRESARVLAQRIVETENRVDRPFIAALGDFNTSIELSRSRPDRALIPASSVAAEDSGLVVFSGRAAASKSHLSGAVWDPWEGVSDPKGSYVYQGDWDRLDHAFIAVSSLHLTDWKFDSFRVVAYAPVPQAYGPRTPNGVSDHFPVLLTLVRRPDSGSP